MISTLVAVGILSGTVVGTVEGLAGLDDLVMTHAEHDLDVAALQSDIAMTADTAEELKAWNKCERLESRIDTLEDRIYRMQQDETPEAQIREVQQDLTGLEQQFTALRCAVTLAG